MSQEWTIDSINKNTTSPADDIDGIKASLEALRSRFSGTARPAAADLVAGQQWIDTDYAAGTWGIYTVVDPAAAALDVLDGTIVTDTGVITRVSHKEQSVALSGTTPAIDCKTGNAFTLTTSGNTTFTFSNAPASGNAYGFTLSVTAGGTHTLTFPVAVKWKSGTAPTAPASGERARYIFFTEDGGTTWDGFQPGSAMA